MRVPRTNPFRAVLSPLSFLVRVLPSGVLRLGMHFFLLFIYMSLSASSARFLVPYQVPNQETCQGSSSKALVKLLTLRLHLKRDMGFIQPLQVLAFLHPKQKVRTRRVSRDLAWDANLEIPSTRTSPVSQKR